MMFSPFFQYLFLFMFFNVFFVMFIVVLLFLIAWGWQGLQSTATIVSLRFLCLWKK